MKLLICTYGCPHASEASRLGLQLAAQVATAVDLLVVARGSRTQVREAQQAAQAAADRLAEAGIPAQVLRDSGRVAREVVRQAQAVPYDLVIIGSRSRHGIARLLLGSVAVRVIEHTPTSVLVVKRCSAGSTPELHRVLVCTAAGPRSEIAVRFAARLARPLDARVTLLHVMSQLPVDRECAWEEMTAQAEELARCGAPEGLHLQQMLGLLAAEGVEARAVVRHGLVLDEVLAEGEAGDYDLLVVGAHITPGLHAFLVEDLARDILLATERPVLVVRQS